MKCNVDCVNLRGAQRIASAATTLRLVDQELSVRVLRNVVAVPIVGYAGLYEKSGNAIASSYYVRNVNLVTNFSVDGHEGVRTIEEPVFFLGKFNVCWGHCITDMLKFLWPFLELERYPALKQCRIVYTTLSRTDQLPENYLAMLSGLGIDANRLVRVDQATVLRTCYFADECFWAESGEEENEHCYASEYGAIINAICKGCSSAAKSHAGRKIYLSRRSWNGWVKGEFGEQFIEDAFAAAGFDIVHPERLSFGEFVATMQNADEVASMECSTSHNALFMRPGAKLILLRKYNRVNLYQMTINQVKSLDVDYVDVYGTLNWAFVNSNQRGEGPFFVYVTKMLANYLGCRPHFPIGEFCRYLGCAITMKIRRILFEACYKTYKLVVVRWLGIRRWERGRVI